MARSTENFWSQNVVPSDCTTYSSHRSRCEDIGPNPVSREVALGWSRPEAPEHWSKWEQLSFSTSSIYRRCSPTNCSHEVWQTVISAEMRSKVLNQMHDSSLCGGHLAVKTTLSRIKQRFWCYGLRSNVGQYYNQCTRCVARSTAGKIRKTE